MSPSIIIPGKSLVGVEPTKYRLTICRNYRNCFKDKDNERGLVILLGEWYVRCVCGQPKYIILRKLLIIYIFTFLKNYGFLINFLFLKARAIVVYLREPNHTPKKVPSRDRIMNKMDSPILT